MPRPNNEPIALAARQTWPDRELRVELNTYRGQWYASLRNWYRDGTTWKPGKGLSCPVRYVPMLRAALEEAERIGLESGWLEEQDYELSDLPLPAALGGEAAA